MRFQSTVLIAIALSGLLLGSFQQARAQGTFIDSGQSLGIPGSFGGHDVELGDLDGDGDLDAFVANASNEFAQVWFNNGSGIFSHSGQTNIGPNTWRDVALADFDNDGDLDALLLVSTGAANQLWLNNGNGTFSNSGQSLGNQASVGVAIGDLNNDGDVDAFIANGPSRPNKVYLSNGNGTIGIVTQNLGSNSSFEPALGDFDGDNDLDAFVVNQGPNRVWLNNGNGSFSMTSQSLGNSNSRSLAIGDIDGDNDLDVISGDYGTGNAIWRNIGNGLFQIAGTTPGSYTTYQLKLGDIDGDGDLDLFECNSQDSNVVYLNDGLGNFTDSGQRLGNNTSRGVQLADLDGDGDLDAFVANDQQGDRVYFNQFPPATGNCPAYDFGWSPLGSCPGDTVCFSIPFPLNGATVSWDFGDGSTSTDTIGCHAFTSAGTYTVELTVSRSGCPDAIVSHSVVINGLVLNAGETHPSTVGGNDGAIDLVVGSGVAPFTYAWSTGATTQDLTGLSAGSYSVTVTDANGCSNSLSVTLNDPLFLKACLEDTLTFVPDDSSGGRTFSWNLGDGTTASSTVVRHSYGAIGTYVVSLTVVDTAGCSSTSYYNIQINQLTVDSLIVADALCNGDASGSATVYPSGGTSPYAYLWSNGSNSQTASGLAAGTYFVTITDSVGCAVVDTAVVGEPAPVVASISGSTPVSCFGGLDGTATVSASGGTPGYAYLWSDGQTGATARGLSAGTYTVTVTDSNGCTDTASVTINEPNPIVITLVAQESCSNDNSGSVTSTVSGGTAPYTYLWNTGATTANLVNAGPGTYTVRVTDSNGCSRTVSITLTGLLSPNSGFSIQR